jgi:hypothetical protein
MTEIKYVFYLGSGCVGAGCTEPLAVAWLSRWGSVGLARQVLAAVAAAPTAYGPWSRPGEGRSPARAMQP